jgi:hypothetical protein
MNQHSTTMKQTYYRIGQDPDDTVEITSPLGLANHAEGYPTSLLEGVPVSVPTPPVFTFDIKREENEKPRHFIKGHRIIVVSRLFLDALRQAGVDNFEVWPAILRDPETGEEWEDYFAFNEIGLLDVVDMDASECDTLMKGSDTIPPVVEFDEIVLNAKKTKGGKMFRVPQDTDLLFISGEVRATLVKLSPPEKWGIYTAKVKVQ